MYYNIEDRSKIVHSVDKLISNFKNIQNKNCLNNITKTVTDSQIQNLIYLLSSEKPGSSDIISKIILSECNRSESIAPGSAALIMRILAYYFSKSVDLKSKKNRLEAVKETKRESRDTAILISKSCRKPEKADIFKIISNLNLPESLSCELKRLIENCRIGDRVEVKKGTSSQTFILEKEGNFLPINIPQILIKGRSSWEFNNVRTILIDGIIEDISQIHHLLERAASDREPYLVICRRASKDVRETVDVNFRRGTLNLILVETEFEVIYHHLFKDMSAIFDCDFINVQMGDTLASRFEKFLFKIDRVKIDSTGINFYHHGNRNEDIRRYLSDIRESASNISNLNEDSIEAINKSIQFRSKFLNSSTKILMIGKDDLDEKGSEISKIDSFMRSIPSIGSLGIVRLEDIKSCNSLVTEAIYVENKNILTQSQIFQSLVASVKIYEMICRAEKLFTIRY